MSKKSGAKYPRKELVLLVNVDRDRNSDWAEKVRELFVEAQGQNSVSEGYYPETGAREIHIILGGILGAKICEN